MNSSSHERKSSITQELKNAYALELNIIAMQKFLIPAYFCNVQIAKGATYPVFYIL